jgi:hypothetical protein
MRRGGDGKRRSGVGLVCLFHIPKEHELHLT